MERSRIINATKWSIICEVIAKIISPITTMVLARILATEVFGIVASITAITSLADLLTDAGFNAYIIQHQFENETEKINTFTVCFWSNFIISTILFFVILFNCTVFSALVGAGGYEKALIVSSLVLPLTSVSSIEQAVMKKELRFKNVGIIKIISKLIPFITTIPLALLGMDYWSLIIGNLVGEVVNVFLCLRYGGFIPCLFYSCAYLKNIFSFSVWAFLESILEWLISNVAILFIGTLFSVYYLGVFKIGINIISQITMSVYALYGNVYKSAISKEQHNPNSFRHIFYNFQKYTSMLSIPICVGAFLYRDLITDILLGTKWFEASTLIGMWGLVSMMSIAFGNFYSDAIRAKGYPEKLVFIDAVYLIAIVIILFNAYKMEFHQFCVSFCIVKIIQPMLQIIVGQKICRVSFLNLINNCRSQIIATGIIFAIVTGFKWNAYDDIVQVLTIMVCIIIYFIVFISIYPERKTLIHYVRKILKR